MDELTVVLLSIDSIYDLGVVKKYNSLQGLRIFFLKNPKSLSVQI